MGAAAVGKTCIINRFLYHDFAEQYKATVEEMHRGSYEVGGVDVTLDLLDTTGAYPFPAMRELSINTGDAFILVYSIDDEKSFQEVTSLRAQILGQRVNQPPIVIVGNKADVCDKRAVQQETAESTALIDWQNGYVEVSAKDDTNIAAIFRELLAQADIRVPPIRQRRMSETLGLRKPATPSMCVLSWSQ